MTSPKRRTARGALVVAQPDDHRLHAGLGQLAAAADVLGRRRVADELARRAGGDHPRRLEMRDLDRRRVAPLGGAVLVQHRELAPHRGGIAEQVAGVGVPGDEA